MATAEKDSLLKNVKIKIKDAKDTEQNSSSNNKLELNISGEDPKEMDKEDNKQIAKEDFELSEKEDEKEEKSNSKVIKEKSEEMGDMQESSKENEKSENKSGYNYKNTNEKEGLNKNGSGGHENEESEKNNSSFLNSNHYNNLRNMDENEDLDDSNNNSNFLDRSKPFLTNGKFMQIQPHFNIFSKQIDDLHNGIYENTKKCLIYKSSLQQSENLMREKANTIVKDLVDKIFNLRQMFLNANRTISMNINEVNNNVIKVSQIQAKTKKEIHDCDHRINDCEGQIGYKLLGKPNYSFMKRFCSTTVK